MATDDDRKYSAGPDAARRFEHTIRRVLTVSKDELTKREAAYQKSKRPKHSKKR